MATKVLNQLNLTNNKITNLGTPTASSDATTKLYVDNAIAASAEGIKTKDPVRFATQSNITIGSALSSHDGITTAVGDRVLVKSQTDAKENGIYVLDSSKIPQRSADANTWAELYLSHVFVFEGTDASKSFNCTIAGTGALGTDDVTFALFTSGNVNSSLLKKKYSATIGDGSTNPITVNHALNETDVSVTVKEISSGELVQTTVTITDANNISLAFGSAPASNALRVVVLG